MGTILFVIFKLTGLVETRFDYVLLCFLISLDTIAGNLTAKNIRK